ncbi:MAG: preprotein translocase subunit SecG [Desulfobacterales bacterium]|uniref:Protein-export membrane protein SecG n=1 Tax=Candidatus Desulfatibia vada TaxID=2841696 RepID=A0A8J6NRR8_9BACT|nr:preprotein translocase subunit SecG [Candidatus Desulfatibia vada]
MSTFLIIMHVIVSIALIMIVLLQTGKGADMGAAFGGGSSQTLFGSSGASTFLGKATTVAAVIFMLTSLVLAYRSGLTTGDSIMADKKAPIEQQAAPTAPAMPAAPDQSAQPAAETVPPLQPAQAGKSAKQ